MKNGQRWKDNFKVKKTGIKLLHMGEIIQNLKKSKQIKLTFIWDSQSQNIENIEIITILQMCKVPQHCYEKDLMIVILKHKIIAV